MEDLSPPGAWTEMPHQTTNRHSTTPAVEMKTTKIRHIKHNTSVAVDDDAGDSLRFACGSIGGTSKLESMTHPAF